MSTTATPQPKPIVSFSYDDLRILGAYGSEVFLRGQCDTNDYGKDDEEKPQPCVIVMKRSLFKKTLNYWLDDKARLCNTWGSVHGGNNHLEFRGTMGSVRAADYIERSVNDRLTIIINDTDPVGPPARTFDVFWFDENTDTGHG
jgi:hypothetical protein